MESQGDSWLLRGLLDATWFAADFQPDILTIGHTFDSPWLLLKELSP